VDPLKAAAATVFCLILFGLVLRLTRRLMDMAIAAGHAEARQRAEDEALSAGDMPPAVESPAPGLVPPVGQAAGAVP
jgi:hypothetical protein